jgi:hypothetical protein
MHQLPMRLRKITKKLSNKICDLDTFSGYDIGLSNTYLGRLRYSREAFERGAWILSFRYRVMITLDSEDKVIGIQIKRSKPFKC